MDDTTRRQMVAELEALRAQVRAAKRVVFASATPGAEVEESRPAARRWRRHCRSTRSG